MPYRYIPIIPGQIYHIFNRSIARQNIFIKSGDYERFLNLIDYYTHENPPLRYSHYNRLPVYQKKDFIIHLKQNNKKLVELFAYCLMPNHFHFLMTGLKSGGITSFMKNIQNSYAKYFNTKSERSGGLFQSMFKTVRIESDEQFIHVNRYLLLNPYTSYIVKNPEDIINYRWSSVSEIFLNTSREIVNKDKILSYFSSPEKFKIFLLDQSEYQRRLGDIKHLMLE